MLLMLRKVLLLILVFMSNVQALLLVDMHRLVENVGVAYATKGPGFTNLLTAMADAYYDSIPVLFITAHSAATLPEGCRLVADQDMDTCGMVRNITKYAKRIDDIEEISISLEKACQIAKDGRKGPVVLDIAASLFKKK